METSELRDTDTVSEVNLSQVVNVQEHEDIDLAKTEHELARMGESPGCGLSNECDEMEIMLGGGSASTSTPNVTLSLSSMPSLVSVSSGPVDSGNDSGQTLIYFTGQSSQPSLVFSSPRAAEPSPAFSLITPRDTVTEILKMGSFMYLFIGHNRTLLQSEPRKKDHYHNHFLPFRSFQSYSLLTAYNISRQF